MSSEPCSSRADPDARTRQSRGSTPIAASTGDRAHLARRAGGAGADRDAREVERHDLGLGLHARHRNAASCWPAAARRAVDPSPCGAIAAQRRLRAGRAGERRVQRRRARPLPRAPKPAMPATFSVPARRPRSWPPPRCSGGERRARRARTSAPTPCGPPSLCADRLR